MFKQNKINYILIVLFGCFLLIGASFGQTQTPEITLTWSADTYAPLNYLGKPLPIPQSNIEVAANIESATLNPETLIYIWSLDDEIKNSQSGLNKPVFRFQIGPKINQKHLIKMDVYNSQGALLAVSPYLLIKAAEPEIILNTKNHSQVFSGLKQEYQFFDNRQINFSGQPYFFNIKNIEELSYNWLLEGQDTSQTAEKNPQLFTIKIGAINKTIKKQLRVLVQNKNNPLENANASAQITFIPSSNQ